MVTLGLQDLIEAVVKHLTDRIALAILFGSVILKILSRLFTLPWVSAHSMLIRLLILFTACYLPTRPILERWNEREMKQKKQRDQESDFKQKIGRFSHLTTSEKWILNEFSAKKSRTASIPLNGQ